MECNSTDQDAQIDVGMSFVLRRIKTKPDSDIPMLASVPVALNFSGLLLKVAFYANSELHLRSFSPNQRAQCANYIKKIVASYPNTRFFLPDTNREGNLSILRSMIALENEDNVEFYDEMESSHRGLVFLLNHVNESAFKYETEKKEGEREFSMKVRPGRFVALDADTNSAGHSEAEKSDRYPIVVMLVDDFVTALRIDGVDKYTVVGRSELGGATICGLGSQLTGARSFDEMLKFAAAGDHSRVDMLVEDIYGSDYASIGLQGDLIASSFAKARRCVSRNDGRDGRTDSLSSSDESKRICSLSDSTTMAQPSASSSGHLMSLNSCRSEDVAKSLIVMYAAFLAQLASLYAVFPADSTRAKVKVKRIIFAGSNVQLRNDVAYALSQMLHFWTGARHDAVFMKHEAFTAPLGLLIKSYQLMDDSTVRWCSTPGANFD